MGRDLHWYVIPKHIRHEPSKLLCFNWEFQPDQYEIINDIETKTGKNMFDYIYSSEYCKEWCPKCHMFACGLYDSPLVVAHHHIGHSYSNPIWSSRWNIHRLVLGDSDTPFAQLFRDDMMYREITPANLACTKRLITYINGEPLRTSDIEAYNEAKEVIDFLECWTVKSDQYHVIMRDEY